MRERRKSKPRRRRNERRPFLIDPEDFDFMDDCELSDWMYGNPSDVSVP